MVANDQKAARYKLNRALSQLAGGLASALLAGCAGTQHGEMVAFLRAHEAEVASGQYIVRAPDTITIHAPGAPEIDGITQSVRSDGKVSLRLLGEIDVAGLTTEGASEKIRAQLARYYVDPEVVVQVADRASQFYYVFGQVNAPGPKMFTGRDTLLRALALAQPNFLAWSKQIRVTRPGVDADERKTIVVDLERMIRTGDMSQNILLQEGDIVDVPPTPLGWLGLRVRELLYPITPALQAYATPSDVIENTHTYEGELQSGNSGHLRDRVIESLPSLPGN